MAAKRLKRAGIVPTEGAEQAALITWWASFCRTKRVPECLLMASSNGLMIAGDSRVRAIRAGIVRRQGVRPGTPDLMLAVARRGFNGLFIEMKRSTGGTISDEQNQFLHELRLAGYNAICARGADEAIRAIKFYLSDVPDPF